MEIKLPKGKIWRLKLPFLPQLAFSADPGQAMYTSQMMLSTDVTLEHIRNGKVIDRRELGSGVITVTFVNTIVSDSVTGTSVVPTASRFKYVDWGTSNTAVTDGDTVLNGPLTSGPARAIATLTNAQTATTGNHTAKLLWSSTTTFSGAFSIQEVAWFDAAGTGNPLNGGNMMDHKTFGVITVANTDQITASYSMSLPSNN